METHITNVITDAVNIHIVYNDDSKVTYPFTKYGTKTCGVGDILDIVGKPYITDVVRGSVGKKRGYLCLIFKDKSQRQIFYCL